MKHSGIPFFLILGMTLFTFSCRTSPDIPATPEVSFQSDVQPILIGSCAQSHCHSASGSGEHEGSLVGYNEVMNTGNVQPGNAPASSLYKIISNHSFSFMPPPPADPLPDKQVKLIYLWIEQGAKNN